MSVPLSSLTVPVMVISAMIEAKGVLVSTTDASLIIIDLPSIV